MNDPLDVLRRDGGTTEPDPAFRARLMQSMREALRSEAPAQFDPHVESDSDGLVMRDHDDEHTELEIIMDPATPGRHRRSMIVAAAVGTAAALLVALVLVVRNGDDPVDPAAPGPSASTPVAPSSTAAPTTTVLPTTTLPPTPTLPPLSDDQIAEAAFLTADEVGDGFSPTSNASGFRLYGPTASQVPECAAFLGTVFENTARPATVAARDYNKDGAGFGQYVVVFPTVDGATAMMTAVADPSFPACWALFTSDLYAKTATCCSDHSYQPSAAHPLVPVGDDMVNLAQKGTFTYLGETFVDEGPTPFVRVGRVVMTLNPPSLATIIPGTGYPDAQFDQALAVSVARLREAQGL